MAPWRIQPSETFLKRLRRCKADKASSGTAAGSSRICPPRTIPHPWAFRKKVRMGLSWHACYKIRCPCLQRRLRPPQDRSDKDWGPQDGARKRWMRPPRGRKSLIRSVQNRGVDAAPRPEPWPRACALHRQGGLPLPARHAHGSVPPRTARLPNSATADGALRLNCPGRLLSRAASAGRRAWSTSAERELRPGFRS